MSSSSRSVKQFSSEEKRALLAQLLQKKALEAKSFPLSYAQQRLWFLDQFQPGSPLYNIPVAMRLSAPLHEEILERSLNEIVRRHETLRTTFTVVAGEPRQAVAS